MTGVDVRKLRRYRAGGGQFALWPLVGLERNGAWWGLKNLTLNFLRLLQRSARLAVVA